MPTRRRFLMALTASAAAAGCGGLVNRAASAGFSAENWGARLVAAAKSQIGKTVIYDPAYVRLAYPGGDIPRERGVCTDVVIRAYRDAFDIDLQKLVHEDMKRNFADYPKIWGLGRTDRNIDHRRVPNLQRFLTRAGALVNPSADPADFAAGDLVSQMLPGNLPHIAIVSDRLAEDGETPLVIHNIGAGARMENRLFAFEHTGHFRFPPLV